MIKKEKEKVKVSLVTQSIKIFWNSVVFRTKKNGLTY